MKPGPAFVGIDAADARVDVAVRPGGDSRSIGCATVSDNPPWDEGSVRVRDVAGNAAAGCGSAQVFNDTEGAPAEQEGQEESGRNSPAGGGLVIRGTAQAGETLTADTSGIADQDGLGNVSFSHQWMAADADINGATSAVAPRPPLTASCSSTPSTHDGQRAFTFELRFREEFSIGYQGLRDQGAFRVTDGTVTRARRLTPGSNIGWETHVEPTTSAEVAVVLPVTTDCGADGAICTRDGRKLSNRNELTASPASS